jgi:uncharacterized protein with HEPN domain
MKGIRNVVVHEYFLVSPQIIWDTIRIDLPQIIPSLKKLIEHEG